MHAPSARALAAAAAALALAATAAPARAQQQDLSQVQVNVTRVAENVYMLVGAGGNVAASAGTDGIILVDDQFAQLTAKLKAALAQLNYNKPIRFVLNTHWHGDHTGGNENLGGEGALIVAQDNVRKRMSVPQFVDALKQTVQASPAVALPVVTFSEDITLHFNGEEIHAFHVPPAHTDGDAIVHFRTSNVIHMGDVYFSTGYPLIDLSSGGSVDGIVAAVDMALPLINETTRVIPGHGPLSNKQDLIAYRDMVAKIRDAVRLQVARKRTLAQVLAAKPTAAYDDKWGKGFIKPDQFVETVYKSLTETPAQKRAEPKTAHH